MEMQEWDPSIEYGQGSDNRNMDALSHQEWTHKVARDQTFSEVEASSKRRRMWRQGLCGLVMWRFGHFIN